MSVYHMAKENENESRIHQLHDISKYGAHAASVCMNVTGEREEEEKKNNCKKVMIYLAITPLPIASTL